MRDEIGAAYTRQEHIPRNFKGAVIAFESRKV